ncbi:protein gravitropic in the light 1 [Tanacetum coccineum]
MEGVVVKPSKHSPNISDIVSKFAKVCKFRSIGVFSSEDPNFQEVCNDVEECVNGVAKADPDGAKVFVDMVEVCGKSGWSGHDEIIKLFDILSEVKLAYVKLQEAHIPYDVEKIRVADEAVLANLDGLCKVRRAFKEKQFQKSNSFSACLTVLRDEKNRMLVLEIKRRKREELKRLNLSSVENVINEVAKGIHDFAKPLIALMKASGWDLDEAANAIQDSVVYSVRSHKKYAFEAYITRRMFNGFSLKSNNVDDILRFNDPLDVLIEEPNGSFAEFCKTKYLLIVHPRIEASFFGHLDQRNFVSSGRHPMTPFYQLFVKMARWVWILQGIAASEPQSEMFVVNRGTVFCDNYMQNIERCKDDDDDMGSFDKQHGMYKVELMVMPGFRIGDKLYKSRVYLSRLSNTS